MLHDGLTGCFPRLYAAASLKLVRVQAGTRPRQRFPRLYAAASLKPHIPNRIVIHLQTFSAALCRGLIEASDAFRDKEQKEPFSAALCRGLIEAGHPKPYSDPPPDGFPRLYAAASLKHRR